MFLKCITKNDVTRLYYYESYYENGKIKQRSLGAIGRLDELKKEYNDPVAHFKGEAEKRTIELKKEKSSTVTINRNTLLELDENNLKNVGYAVLKRLYKQLELDKFWKNKMKTSAIQYNLEKIFQLLVFSRILYPGSKNSHTITDNSSLGSSKVSHLMTFTRHLTGLAHTIMNCSSGYTNIPLMFAK